MPEPPHSVDPVQLGAYFALVEVSDLLRYAIEQQLREAGGLTFVRFQILMRLRLPTFKDPIEVGGLVRWQQGAGVGVQFDGLRARDVWALGKYFESLS